MNNDGLSVCWSDLLGSSAALGYRFVLLRETPMDVLPVSSRVGDIDLLGTRASCRALIAAAFEHATAGRCHLRVRRSSPAKMRVSLCSLDFAESIELDVWEELRQIDDGTRCLRFEDVEPLLRTSPLGPALLRLPIDLEAGIYIEHLHAKARDVRSESATRRLAFYAAGVAGANAPLADAMRRAIDRGEMTATARRLAHDVIARHLPQRPWRQKARRMIDRVRRFEYLRSRNERSAVGRVAVLIGCDGAGKTSVAKAVAESSSAEGFDVEHLVGKQLYRRSLPFRAAYKLNKATINVPSERLDEWLSVPAFFCAARALGKQLKTIGRRHRVKEPSFLLLDRSLTDFLYAARKTESPRFARTSRLLPTRWLAPRLPVVHFVVDHVTLHARKREVSQAGHARYDADMLRRFGDAGPVDYLALSNAGPQADAVAALRRHVDHLSGRAVLKQMIPEESRPLVAPPSQLAASMPVAAI